MRYGAVNKPHVDGTVMTDETSDFSPVRLRQRPRSVQVEPRVPPPPPPPPEGFDISEGERFEYQGDRRLPNEIPDRVRILARAVGTNAHHAEVLKYLAPLIYKNATDTEIAQSFNISVRSVNRWRQRFKEMIRGQFTDKDIQDHWSEARGRLEFVRGVLVNDLLQTARLSGEGGGPALSMRMRLGVVKALMEVERVGVLVDTGYGHGDAMWLERNRHKKQAEGSESKPGDELIKGARNFLAALDDLSRSSMDDLDALFGEAPRVIDVTPERKDPE